MKRIAVTLEAQVNQSIVPQNVEPLTLAQNTLAAVSTAMFLDRLEEPVEAIEATEAVEATEIVNIVADVSPSSSLQNEAEEHPIINVVSEPKKKPSVSNKRGRPKKQTTTVKIPKSHKTVIDWMSDNDLLDKLMKKKMSANEVADMLPSSIAISRSTVSRVVSGLRKNEYDTYLMEEIKMGR